MMDKYKTLVKEYQCSGCVNGPALSCYATDGTGIQCSQHCAGTMISFIGRIFLGMPKGFNRLGNCENTTIYIFADIKDFIYDKLNIPVWKFLDENGNTIIRGLSPRINNPFIHIHIGDVRNHINCIEISQTDLDGWD